MVLLSSSRTLAKTSSCPTGPRSTGPRHRRTAVQRVAQLAHIATVGCTILGAVACDPAPPEAPAAELVLRGELELEPLEQRGLTLFLELGCASCHQGMNVGGNMYQRFGVMEGAFDRPTVELDYGRQLVTGDDRDAHVFRVPSLRNVAVTAPYFHDGSAPELSDAVQKMARVQLGYRLDTEETDAIVAFLHTLTGEWQGKPLTAGGAP